MNLLLELHGDLPDDFPTDERRLYLFGCPRKPCNRKPGSIRAYRATRKVSLDPEPQSEPKEEKKPEKIPEKEPAPKQPPKDLGASLFGATSLTSSVSANANPFSLGAAPSAASNPFAMPKPSTAPASQPSTDALAESFADKVRLSPPEQSQSQSQSATTAPSSLKATPESQGTLAPWPAESAFPAPYQKYYLDAEYETLSRPSTPTVPDNVQMEPMEEEGSGGADLKDAFESEIDKAFMKFSTRLAHNPEQVLRYEFRGTPLLSSYTDLVGKFLHSEHAAGRVTTTGGASRMPRCEYCGAERVFEFQLVPHAIAILEDGAEVVDSGMEWSTIIMGVCAKDCAPETIGQTGWREEWAGVQWEDMK